MKKLVLSLALLVSFANAVDLNLSGKFESARDAANAKLGAHVVNLVAHAAGEHAVKRTSGEGFDAVAKRAAVAGATAALTSAVQSGNGKGAVEHGAEVAAGSFLVGASTKALSPYLPKTASDALKRPEVATVLALLATVGVSYIVSKVTPD